MYCKIPFDSMIARLVLVHVTQHTSVVSNDRCSNTFVGNPIHVGIAFDLKEPGHAPHPSPAIRDNRSESLSTLETPHSQVLSLPLLVSIRLHLVVMLTLLETLTPM
jgi:hypothetical protein